MWPPNEVLDFRTENPNARPTDANAASQAAWAPVARSCARSSGL